MPTINTSLSAAAPSELDVALIPATPQTATDASSLIPYAVLTDAPASKVCLCWIDARESADGRGLVLELSGSSRESEQVEGTALPHLTGTFLYQAVWDNMPPNALHTFRLWDGALLVTELDIRTLPSEIGESTIRYALVSDQHINSSGNAMSTSGLMQPVADLEPDVLLVAGDIVTWGAETSEGNSEQWVRYFSEYVSRVNEKKGHLVPLAVVPGNHEVGNQQWDGTGTVDPELGYFQTLFPYPAQAAPVGENYAAITIAAHTQLLLLDTHSAFAFDVATWMESVIDDQTALVLPIHHSPLLGGGFRVTNDLVLQSTLREEWAPIWADSGNVRATFCGHTHVRKKSVPWTVVSGDPGGDRFDLGGGLFFHEAEGGIVEYGDGYNQSYPPEDEWYLEYSSHARQYFLLEVSAETLTVNRYTQAGALFESDQYALTYDPPPPPPDGLLLSDVVAMRAGTEEVIRAYVGGELVYDVGQEPPPPPPPEFDVELKAASTSLNVELS